MEKITPFLGFDTEALEAAEFYCSLIPNSRVKAVTRYPEGMPSRGGTVMTVEFELDGRGYVALNAGPMFTFSEGVSFQIHTDDQAETDRLWEALTSNGGEESMCGWCKDRFGLSWQVTPKRLTELMSGPDREKASRVGAAMMQMRKIDVSKLEEAAGAG